MTPLQIELTKLIGKKEDWNGYATYNKASLSDFHRWINIEYYFYQKNPSYKWEHHEDWIFITDKRGLIKKIPYDSSKDLLEQDEETLKQMVELIKSNQ